MKIFLTGGTGFLGSYILKNLLNDKSNEVFLLTRPKHYQKLKKKYSEVSNLKLIIGDISNPEVVDDTSYLHDIIENIDEVIHAAAFYDLEGDYGPCFLYNVIGTQNILYLLKKCKNLKKFHYVSTIAVAGNVKGTFFERELDRGQELENSYSKTKYEAERLVRESDLSDAIKIIYRLGILVGDSEKGFINKVDGPYYFYKGAGEIARKFPFLLKSPILALPFSKNAIMPIVPVDHAANVICHCVGNGRFDKSVTFHVVSDQCPTMEQFVQDIMASLKLNMKVIALPAFKGDEYLVKVFGLPKELLSYMFGLCQYDRYEYDNYFKDFKKVYYQDYKNPVMEYAYNNFFINSKNKE